MERVTCTREIDRPAAAVREDIDDVTALTESAGFDSVHRDDDTITVTNTVGLAQLELTFRLRETDADLAYEMTDGLFEEMTTWYDVEATGEQSCRVEITTAFTLGRGVLGDVLDATVIRRQRESELTAQLDWLADGAASATQS
jgi:carbon monoxide dehydrogenase subunit G